MNDEFSRALRPVKARLRRNRFLRGLAFGLLAGLAAALVVRILSLWIPLERKWLWTLLPVPACALLCALFGALRPVRAKDAAEAADAAGLRERTITALENAGRDTEICRLQRADACAALRGLDVKSIRPGSVKKALLASLGCIGLLAALLLIRVPADSAAEARSALRKTLREGSEQVARAAEQDGERLSREERAELRRLTEELDRDLSLSRDEADALVALDRAQQRLEQLRAQTAGGAASAAAQGGASGTGNGKQTGDGGGRQSPGSGQNPNGNSASGTGSAPNTASALSALKAAVNPSRARASGQGASRQSGSSGSSGKSGQSGNSGNQGNSGNSGNSGNQGNSGNSGNGTSGAGQSSQSGAQGQGPGGSGAGGQGNQSGGAGEGSTNLEQGGGGNSSGSHSGGGRDPRYKEEQYETIYDPERAEAVRRDEITNQNRLGDDGSVQAEAGPGKGSLGGDVPWGSVFGEYAETETRSAERENLTGQERQWVSEYFRLLTEQANE